MNRDLYVPAPTAEPLWSVDRVGETVAMVTIFAMILFVGWASCWEAIQ